MTSKLKILIVQPQGIGDQIMITPLLKLLKRNYKDSFVRIIVSTETAKAVVDDSLLVDDIVVFNRKKESLFTHIKLIKDNFVFAPTVCYIAPPSNNLLGQALSWLSGAKIRIGEKKTIPVFGFTHSSVSQTEMHMVELHIHLFNLGLSLKGEIPKPFFNLTTKEISIGNSFFTDNKLQNKFVMGMHVGGQKNTKYRRYPIERFQSILKQYINESVNHVALLFFGPEEDDLVDQIETHPRVIVLRKKSIKYIASVISNVNLMITSDSGLGHIASAFKVPIITIFGPENSRIFSPYGLQNTVIETEKILECKPCTNTGEYIYCTHFDCLNTISTKTVLKEIFKKTKTQ